MNCTQETYHRCLATVAPREVAAARANGTYSATWNSKKPNKTDLELRAKVLDMLSSRPLTTEQVRARTSTARPQAYALLQKMEYDGLVKSRKVVVDGSSTCEWRLAILRASHAMEAE